MNSKKVTKGFDAGWCRLPIHLHLWIWYPSTLEALVRTNNWSYIWTYHIFNLVLLCTRGQNTQLLICRYASQQPNRSIWAKQQPDYIQENSNTDKQTVPSLTEYQDQGNWKTTPQHQQQQHSSLGKRQRFLPTINLMERNKDIHVFLVK